MGSQLGATEMLPTLLLTVATPPWHLHLGRDYTGPPRHEHRIGATPKFYNQQSLDHLASNAERSANLWSQRYFENTTLWGGPGFPVFLSLGGEGPVGGPPGGLQHELASTHRAALVALEHRFYGESRPTLDMSSEALRHLSAEQALADAAQFIEWWSTTHAAGHSPWIAWGGSYSGQLAAWLRLRYPSSVAAAVAYSGPILSQLDFYEYNQVVTDVVASYGGAQCVALLKSAFVQLSETLGDGGRAPGREGAARWLHACNVTSSAADDGVLVGAVQGRIQSLVQYNQHGAPNHTVAAFCAAGLAAAASASSTASSSSSSASASSSSSRGGVSPLEALGVALGSIPGGACLGSSYAAYMAPLLDSNFSTGTPTNRQWFYQLCNEFGQQTCEPGVATDCAAGVPGLSPSLFAPLSHEDDLSGGLQMCQRLFGIDAAVAVPPALWSARQRGWTNVAHGGRAIGASNVLFVNGRADPYSSVSLLPEQLSAAQAARGVRAVAVRNGSHCVGMGATSSARDSADEAAAKKAVGEAVAEWLREAAADSARAPAAKGSGSPAVAAAAVEQTASHGEVEATDATDATDAADATDATDAASRASTPSDAVPSIPGYGPPRAPVYAGTLPVDAATRGVELFYIFASKLSDATAATPIVLWLQVLLPLPSGASAPPCRC